MLLKKKNKLGRAYKILFAILTPIAILSLVVSISIFNYFNNKNDEIYNIAEIDLQNLDMDSDIYHYYKIGFKTIIGVDLSEHNKEVDFEEIKKQGVEFVILRLGWRGYLNPEIHLDKYFEEYYQKAKDAGLNIGVYFFSQAINEEEAIEEAQFVIDNLSDKTIDLYVAYDYESIDNDTARTDDLTRHQATQNAYAFLNTISNAGYEPILYTNYNWIKYHYEFGILFDYPIWYAQYSKKPQYRGKYIIWQYATSVPLNGISSNDGVDLNLMIIKEDIN